MQTINRFGGDAGKIVSPNFRKHLRRRRTLDMLNAICEVNHDSKTLIGRKANKYIPVYLKIK